MSPNGLIFLWPELGHGNITFLDELDFDPAELDIVYRNGVGILYKQE